MREGAPEVVARAARHASGLAGPSQGTLVAAVKTKEPAAGAVGVLEREGYELVLPRADQRHRPPPGGTLRSPHEDLVGRDIRPERRPALPQVGASRDGEGRARGMVLTEGLEDPAELHRRQPPTPWPVLGGESVRHDGADVAGPHPPALRQRQRTSQRPELLADGVLARTVGAPAGHQGVDGAGVELVDGEADALAVLADGLERGDEAASLVLVIAQGRRGPAACGDELADVLEPDIEDAADGRAVRRRAGIRALGCSLETGPSSRSGAPVGAVGGLSVADAAGVVIRGVVDSASLVELHSASLM